jgi:hypothetical protein
MEKPKAASLESKTLFCLFLILLITGIVLSLKNQSGSATVTYGAAFLCLIFSSLEKFEWFEAFGVKAKLDKKIQEADDAIRKLKEIAIPFAELLLTQTARSGRMGTIIKRRERYRLVKDIEKPLLGLGVTKEELEKIKNDWYRFDLFDLCVPIWDNLKKSLDAKLEVKRSGVPIANIATANKLHEEIRQLEAYKEDLKRIAYQNNLHTTYQGYIDFINDCSAFEEQEKEMLLKDNDDLIKDLKYYCDNHDFRRPEYWFKKDDD